MQLSLPITKSIFRNQTLLVYGDQAIVSGFSFLSGVTLARYLGVNGFGIYSIAWLGVLIASSINQPLIIAPMQTLSGKKNIEEQEIYLQALVFKQLLFAGIMAVLGFFAVVVMGYFLQNWKVESIIIAFPLAVFSYLLQDFFRRYFFIIGKPHKAMLVDFVAYGGVLLSAFCIHFVKTMDAQFVLLLTALFFLYAALIGLWSMPHLRFNWRSIKEVILEHWDFSKWLTATALLQWFSGNLFIIAAGAIMGPVAVGATRMAQNIVGITHVLFLAMENIIPSRAANFQRLGGNQMMFSYLWKFTMQMGIITIALLALIAIFSGEIITLCYGAGFLKYRAVLIGFCMLYVIVFFGYPLRYAIRTLERTRLIFMSFIASSTFSIICAYPIIKMFGLNGIVVGLMITQLITLGIYLYNLRKVIHKF
jgi:O-antigen/teichoic acid export membrane protein